MLVTVTLHTEPFDIERALVVRMMRLSRLPATSLARLTSKITKLDGLSHCGSRLLPQSVILWGHRPSHADTCSVSFSWRKASNCRRSSSVGMRPRSIVDSRPLFQPSARSTAR